MRPSPTTPARSASSSSDWDDWDDSAGWEKAGSKGKAKKEPKKDTVSTPKIESLAPSPKVPPTNIDDLAIEELLNSKPTTPSTAQPKLLPQDSDTFQGSAAPQVSTPPEPIIQSVPITEEKIVQEAPNVEEEHTDNAVLEVSAEDKLPQEEEAANEEPRTLSVNQDEELQKPVEQDSVSPAYDPTPIEGSESSVHSDSELEDREDNKSEEPESDDVDVGEDLNKENSESASIAEEGVADSSDEMWSWKLSTAAVEKGNEGAASPFIGQQGNSSVKQEREQQDTPPSPYVQYTNKATSEEVVDIEDLAPEIDDREIASSVDNDIDNSGGNTSGMNSRSGSTSGDDVVAVKDSINASEPQKQGTTNCHQYCL